MGADEVLKFWFERDRKAWYQKNPAFDGDIRTRFLCLFEQALKGELKSWQSEAASCLALVILLDQFPRNMFRNSARAFAADPLARDAARVVIERGWDKNMAVDERTFAYLPFEHSESPADQALSCELMKPLGEETYRHAVRHKGIIDRFGRFPHRNAALGRMNTPEEIEFLTQPGSSF
ncbi:MAG TPA: DUF924 family protein [Burkholderiales bacterium]|nr:DUF924 family protein [Burkholderiales bacterium]